MTKTKSRTARWIKVLAITGVFLAISLSLMAVGGLLLLRNVAARITIDPQAVSDVVREAVVITLSDGMADQRVELLNHLAAMGPAAQEFLPSIQQCADDPNPHVRTAARAALTSIAP